MPPGEDLGLILEELEVLGVSPKGHGSDLVPLLTSGSELQLNCES